jgi:hypothetical protein
MIQVLEGLEWLIALGMTLTFMYFMFVESEKVD